MKPTQGSGSDRMVTDNNERLVEEMGEALSAVEVAIWEVGRERLQEGRRHLTVSGTFQSDRYQTVPAGKVPLSVRDPLAQDLLWKYANRHREAAKHGDSQFSRDLEDALRNAGFEPSRPLDERDEHIQSTADAGPILAGGRTHD